MSSYQRDLPAEGLEEVEIEICQGSLNLRTAEPGEGGRIESGAGLEAEMSGSQLRIRQPGNLGKLLGVHLFGGGGGDTKVVLPCSVRRLKCSTGHGDIRIEGVRAEVRADTGKGKLFLSGAPADKERASSGAGSSPWSFSHHLSTGWGSVEVQGIQGSLEASTGWGDLRLEDVGGQVEASTGCGSIAAGGISGRAKLATGFGDVVATDLDNTQLKAETGMGRVVIDGRLSGARVTTGSGEIICHYEAIEGDHRLESGNGDIRLHLFDGAETRINATTRHGRIETDLPLVKVGTSGPEGRFSQRFVGSTGGGNPRASITLHTHHGDIRIARHGAKAGDARLAPAPRPEGEAVQPQELAASPDIQEPKVLLLDPPAAPLEEDSTLTPSQDAPEDTSGDQSKSAELQVLEAVSRGELSVEEALLLLDKSGPNQRPLPDRAGD